MLIFTAITLAFVICMRNLPSEYAAKPRATASICISMIATAIVAVCQRAVAHVAPDRLSITYSYKANAYLASTAISDLHMTILIELLVSFTIFIGWILCRQTLTKLLRCSSEEIDRLLARLGAYISMTWLTVYISLIVSGL